MIENVKGILARDSFSDEQIKHEEYFALRRSETKQYVLPEARSYDPIPA
jgi:hypothetical protein